MESLDRELARRAPAQAAPEADDDPSNRPTRSFPPPAALLEVTRGGGLDVDAIPWAAFVEEPDPDLAACPTPKYPFWVQSVDAGRASAVSPSGAQVACVAIGAPRRSSIDPFAIDRRRRALRALAVVVLAIAALVALVIAARSGGPSTPRAWW